jgi:hypothetical protein
MMRSLLFVVALGSAACGTHYAFVPVSPAHVVPAFKRDAAYVAIPEQDPHGDLRVLSYGVERLTTGDPEEPSADDDVVTLHLRVLVENTGSKPWALDTREQRIVVDGLGAESPSFVVSDRSGDGSAPPVVNLTFGATRIVDLFYPVPNGVDAMPAFRAVTKVRTDEGDVTETTPFQRVSVSILSPYMQEDDGTTDADYDYMFEPFMSIAGGVSGLRSRGHAWYGGAGGPGGGGGGGHGRGWSSHHARGGATHRSSSGHGRR